MSPVRGRRTPGQAPAQREGARLRLARLARGLSQEDLARAAGVSRQAVAGIEAGRFDPSLRVGLALAAALESQVEELFGPVAELEPVSAVPLRSSDPGGRVDVARVGATTVALPLDGEHTLQPGFAAALGWRVAPDDGGLPLAASASHPRWTVRPTRPLPPALVIAGCDPAISLLSGPLSSLDPPVGLRWWPCASSSALDLAARGLVHAAGAHGSELSGDGSGVATSLSEELATAVPDELAAAGFEAVAFTSWNEGIASSRDVGPVDLGGVAARNLRFVNRQPGSEAHALVESEMARRHLVAEDIVGYGTAAGSHLLVAAVIASGAADAGVTIEPAALAYGLAFTPLASERFVLFLPRPVLQAVEVRALLRVLASPALRDQLSAIPGYRRIATCGIVLSPGPAPTQVGD